MIYEVVIAACLVILTFNLILNLRSLKIPSSSSKIPEPAPLVSVLLPTRNEEENIASCLESLQTQDYPNYEILVLDDGSTDGTAGIVSRMASQDSRIELLKGEPLPPGWAGKAHACQQLAQKARGTWILFTDADTLHKPNMMRSVLALALENKPTLLTGFPLQITDSLTEKIAIPVFYFIIMSWLPMWWLQRSKKPRPNMTNGQFLLFRKDDYFRIGGHAAVKSRILEDIWLGAQVYHKGGNVLAVDLSPVVSCRMYQNIGQMWQGFSKSIYALPSSTMVLLVLGTIAYFLFLAPFYTLINHYVITPTPLDWWYLVIFQVLAIIFMRLLVNNHFKESIFTTVFHPVGFCFFLVEAVYVICRHLVGSGITWKERLYKPGGGVD